MAAPQALLDLVARFELHREAYRSGAYNEAQARVEFIDPMFRLLGWDMYNEQGYAEAYKDVIHEHSIKREGGAEAPDYCFRIGQTAKFFVEAKKPSVNLKDDISPAFQLRRYAWTVKLPLSVLTDFEELAVYDCRTRPDKADKASTARVFYARYDEYAQRWDEIAAIFSRDAVLKGSFDKYAASATAKRGTAEVDEVFLHEIESWRDVLARNIALRNPTLGQRELNVAVQATIDRIIFLRICEGRGIEEYGRLLALTNATQVYARLCDLFQGADERYNSGLFHFRPEKERTEAPDALSLTLAIDDKPLKDIIKSLYYPDSPYEFAVLPADILGQVYEQFLGKVIRLTGGHRAVIEDKPEVKKAGGVYYTPTYIVEYIVEHTVGELLKDKTPAQVSKLRVLDPACGSGSFLIVAYQRLLDWHEQWYIANDRARWATGRTPAIHQRAGGGWRLTTAERKRILLNNIFGVDIDLQAVEVTKLSLLLKVLEGESEETLHAQLRLFRERALPDLSNNIKCGNSLIGPDFYDNQQMSLLDDEQRYRINVFDWRKAFPQVFAGPPAPRSGGDALPSPEVGGGVGGEGHGGFDAVIGNPPYVRQEALAEYKAYWQKRYSSYSSTADLYVYFIERGLSLLRHGGLFSVVVSSSFLRTSYGLQLRRHLRDGYALRRIVDFGGLSLFSHAKDVYVCVPVLCRDRPIDQVRVCKVKTLEFDHLSDYVAEHAYEVPISRFSDNGWSLETDDASALFDKITGSGVSLGQYVHGRIYYGIKTGLNVAFELDAGTRRRMLDEAPQCQPLVKSFLGGQDIRRYAAREPRYMIVIPSGWTSTEYRSATGKRPPSEREAWTWFAGNYQPLARHLSRFSDQARRRQDQGEYWWELRSCDYYGVLDGPKIVYPDIAKYPRFYLDLEGIYVANTAYCLGSDDRYLIGILNSRLNWFAIARVSIPFGTRAGEFRYRLIYQYMERLPIRTIDVTSAADRARHDQMVELVERMLALHKQLAAARTAFDKESVQRQIDITDRQIDRLVYELYGLTDDEIALVEGG